MMKKLLTLLVFLLPSYSLAARPEEISVKNGSNFQIKLPSNPTTGFGWMVKSIPANVILTGMNYNQSANCNGALGCGGEETLFFKAIEKGKGDIVLKYGQPFNEIPKESTVKTIFVK